MDENYSVVGPLVGPPRDCGRHVLLARATDGLHCAAKTIPCGRDTPQRLAARRVVEIMRRVKNIAGLVDAVETETGVTLMTEFAALGSLREEIRRRRGLLRQQRREEQVNEQHAQQKRLSRLRAVYERGVEADASMSMETAFFAEDEIVRLIMQLLNILQQLYAQGIVHDRITSDHILLYDDNFSKVRLCGFGNAFLSCDEKESEGKQPQQQSVSKGMHSSENSSLSTSRGYRFFSDSIPRESKHDIWLIGAIVYEMCTLGTRINLQTNIVTEPFIAERYSPGFHNMLLSMLTKDPSSRPTCAQLEYMLSRHRPSGFGDSRCSVSIPLSQSFSIRRDSGRLFTGTQPSSEYTQYDVSVHSMRTDPRDKCDTLNTVFHVLGGSLVPSRYRCNSADVTEKQQRIPLSYSEVENCKNNAIGVEPLNMLCVESDIESVKISDCGATKNSSSNNETSVKTDLMGKSSLISSNKVSCSKSSSTIGVVEGVPFSHQRQISQIKTKNSQNSDETNCCFDNYSENDIQLLRMLEKKLDAQKRKMSNTSPTSNNKLTSVDEIPTLGEERVDYVTIGNNFGAGEQNSTTNTTTTTTVVKKETSIGNSLSPQPSCVNNIDKMVSPPTLFSASEKEICESMQPHCKGSLNFSIEEHKSEKVEGVNNLRRGSKKTSLVSSITEIQETRPMTPLDDLRSVSDALYEETVTTTVRRRNLFDNTLCLSAYSATVDVVSPITNTEFCDGATEYSACSSFVVVHEAPNTRGNLVHRSHLRPHRVVDHNHCSSCFVQ
ncbi:putative serine/threonine-protein kinase Nek3-like isoform 8 [Trypanosoma theileri]|uniref:non-specific serine/threonine protein kinase n=1 Tax=Trypanosoma theileri TaxID=67003 RepID=A0A1X0P975_9TRYP|nr:putative serine/threonine-protein kinase Nek3-like isoform 8 [Trypanosoma theileri]ORC93381.1 putative serine/threonine-protein kinase Nek3-like isoform 8 [Trypanosoma theileri]